MSVKQISIFVENRPGAMHEMTNVLAENKIDMRALSLAETEGFGIVRIIVDDAYEATTVLKEAGYINKLTPVVVVAIPDETGGLNKVLQLFTDNEINVDYMYAILGGKEINEAYMIFKVDDPKKAESVLRAKGIRIVQQEEMAAL
ncbi:MAG: ACT domain-containing protein [Eubacterium sp.]|nr:ACT domain-containing protein [Eubacterium sp.]